VGVFQAIKMRQGKTGRRGSKHRQSLVTLSRRHSLVKVLEGGEEGPPPLRRGVSIDVGPREPPKRGLQRRASLDELETETCLLAPRIQRRITPLSPRLKAELLALRHHALHDPTVIQEVDELDSPQPYPL
jgi:5'-nucleotidase